MVGERGNDRQTRIVVLVGTQNHPAPTHRAFSIYRVGSAEVGLAGTAVPNFQNQGIAAAPIETVFQFITCPHAFLTYVPADFKGIVNLRITRERFRELDRSRDFDILARGECEAFKDGLERDLVCLCVVVATLVGHAGDRKDYHKRKREVFLYIHIALSNLGMMPESVRDCVVERRGNVGVIISVITLIPLLFPPGLEL